MHAEASLIDGGQGESLVPPYTRGSISVSLPRHVSRRILNRVLNQMAFYNVTSYAWQALSCNAL